MRRLFTMTAVAVGFAGLLGIQTFAQQNPTQAPPTAPPQSAAPPAAATQNPPAAAEDQTKIKTEHANEVTLSGCLQTGTEAKTYILDKVEPVKTTEVVGTSGSVMTVTKYELVPSEKIEFQEHVGHKVEVVGVSVPAGDGDAKIKTETKVPGSQEKTETKIAKGATPQFRVISIKQLADSCSM
jgi:cytoskeletal protein RodZ